MATNKKLKRNNSYSERERKRYVYIGDYHNECNNNNNYNVNEKIEFLTKRLNILESILTSNRIIKAKPVLSIISGNIHCLNKINNIYENWINYISNITNAYEINYNVQSLFWKLDYFIFNNYFLSLIDTRQYIFEFVNVDFENNTYTDEQYDIIKRVLHKNRNNNFKLLYPHHKEYISIAIINNRIFLVYFEDELYKIVNYDYNNKNNNDNKDFQFCEKQIHSNFSFNNDVTGEVEINVVNLKKNNMTTSSNRNNNNNSKNDSLELSDIVDKRQLILQNKKPLYNTLVDIEILNKLNSSLFRFNPVFLNLSLIIFHAMLHMKKDIINNDNNYDPCFPHNSFFMKEYLNFTPSALYGHAMIPPLTLS